MQFVDGSVAVFADNDDEDSIYIIEAAPVSILIEVAKKGEGESVVIPRITTRMTQEPVTIWY